MLRHILGRDLFEQNSVRQFRLLQLSLVCDYGAMITTNESRLHKFDPLLPHGGRCKCLNSSQVADTVPPDTLYKTNSALAFNIRSISKIV